jgi:four helix bundle protein
MVIDKFEDIDAWKEARKLVKMIYDLAGKGGLARDFGLLEQIRRAAVSIKSNIAEGFGRGTNKEFVQFLVVARASAFEVKSQLYVALDCKYVDDSIFHSAYQQTNAVINLTSGLIRYLKNSGVR